MRQSIPDTAPSATSLGPRCRRLLITAPSTVELIEERLPPVGERDVYARTMISGISHGTEIAWLRGEAAALHRRWDPERRFFINQPGRDFPVAPGYESVARVEQVGPAVTAVAAGDLIAIDAPHADAHLLTEQAAAAGHLPADVDPEQAVFFTLARVALGGVHDAAIALGDTVVVVGLGTVGLLAVTWPGSRARTRRSRHPAPTPACTKRSAACESVAGSPPSPPTTASSPGYGLARSTTATGSLWSPR